MSLLKHATFVPFVVTLTAGSPAPQLGIVGSLLQGLPILNSPPPGLVTQNPSPECARINRGSLQCCESTLDGAVPLLQELAPVIGYQLDPNSINGIYCNPGSVCAKGTQLCCEVDAFTQLVPSILSLALYCQDAPKQSTATGSGSGSYGAPSSTPASGSGSDGGSSGFPPNGSGSTGGSSGSDPADSGSYRGSSNTIPTGSGADGGSPSTPTSAPGSNGSSSGTSTTDPDSYGSSPTNPTSGDGSDGGSSSTPTDGSGPDGGSSGTPAGYDPLYGSPSDY